jgi:hypothetical protein
MCIVPNLQVRKEHELIPPFYTISHAWEHSPNLLDTVPRQGALKMEVKVSQCKCGQIHPINGEGNPEVHLGLCKTCKVFKNIGPHGLEPDGCSNCFLIGCL